MLGGVRREDLTGGGGTSYFAGWKLQSFDIASNDITACANCRPKCPDCIPLEEVTITGKSRGAQFIPIPLPKGIVRPIPLPMPWTGHGNNKRNNNYHYVYQIISYDPASFVTLNATSTYEVYKYGISQDDGWRVKDQVKQLNNSSSTVNRVYDYSILHSGIEGRANALLIEQFYVTKYFIINQDLPQGNKRPGPWR